MRKLAFLLLTWCFCTGLSAQTRIKNGDYKVPVDSIYYIPHRQGILFTSSFGDTTLRFHSTAQTKQFDGHLHPNGIQLSLSDTGSHRLIAFNDHPHLFDVMVSKDCVIILSISSPDSAKTVTVRFSKSRVHFINYSTFTFKQP